MIRDRKGVDLKATPSISKVYSMVVCMALEARLKTIMSYVFKILNPIHMPHRQVGLASWCIVELDIFLQHFGQEKTSRKKDFLSLKETIACKL